MNVYLRNWIIALIVNAVVFLIGWGCIVPDQLSDQTHLFGLVGSVEIIKGNTAVVFGMCALLATLSMIAAMVEAIIEDYRRPCFNQSVRVEKPRKPLPTGTFAGNKMRIEPTAEKVCEDPKTSEKVVDGDPKTPTLD